MGEGVALLIKKNISFEELNLNEYNIEIVGIKIKTINNKSLHIFSYYDSVSFITHGIAYLCHDVGCKIIILIMPKLLESFFSFA